jgi:hypothetical protein
MFAEKIPSWMLFAFAGYFLLFSIVVAGIHVWRVGRRQERPPEKFKLLRGPGETLRRRVQKADEDLVFRLAIGAFVPIAIACGALLIATALPKPLVLLGAVFALLVFFAAVFVSALLLFRVLNRRRNDFLGYLGERLVAEHLDTLRHEGYRVFHDVPAEGRDKRFNLDHVVVGPNGIVAVETKTRRKKKARQGREEHVVRYDGRCLVWPWGEETCGIEQAEAQMDWLRKWIYKRTGISSDIKPVLVIPGWYVKEQAIGSVRVANQKLLPSIVKQWKPQPLRPEQVDLISRQLDDLCRDVED